MAKIYDNQIEWQAPTAHRFQAQPLKDYVSQGLDNLAGAAEQASKGIQTLKDKDAADKMAKADKAADLYIKDFQDFTGDNYLEKMESGAMKIWDEAFGTLDEPTKRRFEQNNPEARNIFQLKTKEAALDRTYAHEKQAWDRQLPSIANEVASLRNTNAIKKAAQDWVFRLTEGSGMRYEDAAAEADKLQKMIAQGAITQAIGEGRTQDAYNMLNDKWYTSLLTPEEVGKYNKTLGTLIDEQSKTAKETDANKVLTDKMTEQFVLLYDQMYASAGTDEAAREAATISYNKFLNDFLLGNLKDEYMGIPLSSIMPEGALLTDTPFSVRQKIVKNSVDATLEGNPIDKKIKTELGYRAVAKAASLANSDGDIVLDKVKIEDMADIAVILDQVQGYYGFDDGVQKSIDKLHNAYSEYLDRAEKALQFSAFEDENTVIAERTGLGWRTERYAQSGNITPATASALRDGAYKNTQQGTLYSDDYKVAMDAGIQNLAAWTNNGTLPESGSYREMLMQEAVNYSKMSIENKKALGIENVTNRQIIANLLQQTKKYDDLGLLDSQVGDTKTGVRPVAIKPRLEQMTPSERQELFENASKNNEFSGFISRFQEEHDNLHPDAIRALAFTNGNVGEEYVGRPWILKDSHLGTLKPFPSSNSKGNTREAKKKTDDATYGAPITKEQLDKANKDWKEQVVPEINYALMSDYAFRSGFDKNSDVYKIVSGLGPSSLAANQPQVPIADAIQDTPYYDTFIEGIKGLNKGANPDQTVAANFASANRSTAYKSGADKAQRARVSNSARKADKNTNAYKVPYAAGAYPINVY